MSAISVVTDSFWDDIVGIIYLLTFESKMYLFPTSIGYTQTDTCKEVCGGLQRWSSKLKINHVSHHPFNEQYYQPLNDPTAFQFGRMLSKHLHFDHRSPKLKHLKPRGDVLILGPYNGMARKLNRGHQIFSSFSNLHFPEDGSFPSPINLGAWSNAGIDPCGAMEVWRKSCQPALLLAHQPPIDLVIASVTGIDTRPAKRMLNVLNYSKLHNPAGGYVWDLGLAIVYKNPDIITKTQLYTVTQSAQQLTLTAALIRNTAAVQVYLVDVDLNCMMQRLRDQLRHS